METVFGTRNKFQNNHWSFKSTAAGQAVLRASKLQVFYHHWCWFLSAEYSTSRANLLSGVFTSTWFTQLWYREPRYTLGMNRATNIDFLRRLRLQMLECLKSPFVTHAALFLESTSKNVNVIRDWE